MYKLAGFDDCVVGLASGCQGSSHVCYSVDLIIDKLCRENGCEPSDAYAYLIDNLLHADFGTDSPVFLEPSSMDQITSVGTAMEQIIEQITSEVH